MVRIRNALALLAMGALALATTALHAQEAVEPVPAAGQAALLHSDVSNLARNKRVVFDYWRTVRQAGDAAKVPVYIDSGYKSHDPAVGGGRQELIDFVKRQATPQPLRDSLDGLVNLVAENDFVMLQTLTVIDHPNDPEIQYQSVNHDVFRLRDGKIVEQWSTARITAERLLAALKKPQRAALPLPGKSSPSAVPLDKQEALLANRDPQLVRNKRAAFDFFRIVVESGRLELAEQYVDAGYIQHNPIMPSGRDALVKFFGAMLKPKPAIQAGVAGLVNIIAERDLVVLMQSREQDGAYAMLFDVFRIKDGKVAEHWDSTRFPEDVAMRRRGQPGIQPAVPLGR